MAEVYSNEFFEMQNLGIELSQKTLEQAISQSPVSILITDINGTIEFVNPAFTKISGYTLNEVIGKNPKILSSGTHSKDFYKNLWSTILKGQTWRGEFLNLKKDGSTYWESAVISSVFNNNNDITHFVCTKEDITERKLAAQALLNSEARFKSFFNQSNAPMLVVDPESELIIEANKAAQDFYGYSNIEFSGLNLKKEFIGFIEAVKVEATESFLDFKNVYAQRHRLKNQHYRDVEIFPARVVHNGKTLLHIIIQDITKRKQAIEALKASESKKLALLKIFPDLIFVLNSKGEFADIYTDHSEKLGIEPFKLIGKKTHQYFPEELSKILEEKIKYANETRQVQSFEFRQKKEHNQYIYEEIRVIASGDSEVLVIIRDISKQKIVEAELKGAWEDAEEANRMKDVFLANISHEIRTPLNSILGFSDILGSEITDQVLLKHLESIRTSSKTLLGLINDLLDLSKIEAGKMSVSMQDINLHMLLNDMQNIFSLKVAQKKLSYKIEIDKSVPRIIRFDEIRLRQILINLIGNAIKFTEKGGITLLIKASGLKYNEYQQMIDISIDVKDTGIGISVENQQKVFEAFKQQDSQDARKYDGTGLGLAITKRLVEMLNGTIVLTSSPEIGSTFSIHFNQVEVLDQTLNVQEEINEYKIGKIKFAPAKILIADDIPINREFLKNIFKGSEITFIEAENGEEAIEKVKQFNPKLALLDLRMPIIDGLGVAQFIKTSDDFKNIATIGISATIISYDVDFRSIYLDDFVSKPVDISDLLKKISQYIPALKTKSTNQQFDINYKMIEKYEKANVEKYDEIFKSEISPLLLKLSNTSSFADYEKFSKILILKGDELKIKHLTFIGNSIAEAAKSFDLDVIVKLVEDFKIFNKKVLNFSHE